LASSQNTDVASLADRLSGWRRAFHRNPEPGFCEFETAARLIGELRALGYHVRCGDEAMDLTAAYRVSEERVRVWEARARANGRMDDLIDALSGGRTAVVATLTGRAGATVAMRFDMDALPIQETHEPDHAPTRLGFASANPGLMHACGHDGHMAIGLGVASILAERRSLLNGKVHLIFQPAEEGAPGGAATVAARGVVDDVDYLLCCHLGLQARALGHVVCRTEFLGTSKYRLVFHGRSSHVVNAPEHGRNALLAAASAALAIHATPPHSNGWFSVNVGVLHAGSEQGVTPGFAEMELGLWATNTTVLEDISRRVHEVAEGTAAAWDVGLEIDHIGEAPNVRQDEELARVVERVATRLPRVTDVDEFVSCRAGEDATILLQRVQDRGGQGIYILIGSGLTSEHHAPDFDFDEEALLLGAELLSETALELLG
jgi:aminobenzoyl-glutamate utilization protein A